MGTPQIIGGKQNDKKRIDSESGYMAVELITIVGIISCKKKATKALGKLLKTLKAIWKEKL